MTAGGLGCDDIKKPKISVGTWRLDEGGMNAWSSWVVYTTNWCSISMLIDGQGMREHHWQINRLQEGGVVMML